MFVQHHTVERRVAVSTPDSKRMSSRYGGTDTAHIPITETVRKITGTTIGANGFSLTVATKSTVLFMGDNASTVHCSLLATPHRYYGQYEKEVPGGRMYAISRQCCCPAVRTVTKW
ncbi:hypothetical protein J6590_051151 [Homalodisca vitripennis]|nr:hypothetical protein J6590_051151 [Homalodisca vitripennis]